MQRVARVCLRVGEGIRQNEGLRLVEPWELASVFPGFSGLLLRGVDKVRFDWARAGIAMVLAATVEEQENQEEHDYAGYTADNPAYDAKGD